jgi:hypothetical protein
MAEPETALTRGDDLRDVVRRLQNHAHLCVDGQDFEPAQRLIAAAQLINEALNALSEQGTDEEPYEESAHTRAGG